MSLLKNEIKTDKWSIQTLRCRESTKLDLKKLIDYLGITQDDFLKESINMYLRELSKGKQYINDRQYPYLKEMPRLISNSNGRRKA